MSQSCAGYPRQAQPEICERCGAPIGALLESAVLFAEFAIAARCGDQKNADEARRRLNAAGYLVSISPRFNS